MSVSDSIADAIAQGIKDGLEASKKVAYAAIDQLDSIIEERHQKAGELSSHVATRPGVERVAMEQMMGGQNPATGKDWTKTDAMSNLDMIPEFAGWRQRRNTLEGEFHYLDGKVEVQKRRADLAIVTLQLYAKEV